MKKETVVKVLRRYAIGLRSMEVEAMAQNEPTDAKHYRFDKNVMIEAIKMIENGKEQCRILVDQVCMRLEW